MHSSSQIQNDKATLVSSPFGSIDKLQGMLESLQITSHNLLLLCVVKIVSRNFWELLRNSRQMNSGMLLTSLVINQYCQLKFKQLKFLIEYWSSRSQVMSLRNMNTSRRLIQCRMLCRCFHRKLSDIDLLWLIGPEQIQI